MPSQDQNVSPQVLASIAKELRKLVNKPPEGISVIVNEEDMTDVQAQISGPQGTPYESGSFRVKLVLSADFPQSPPRGVFITKIYHPNVDTRGNICVNTLKKDWDASLGIGHILQVIRCLLIVPFPESALNEEASKLFLESYDEYAKRARLMTSIHAASSGGGGTAKAEEAKRTSGSKSKKHKSKKKSKERKRQLKRL